MGLLDGIAYGLAGGLAGGAEAAQPALAELQKGEISKQLAQQTADLHVQSEKQIQDYAHSYQNEQRQRVGGIVAGSTKDVIDPVAGGNAQLPGASNDEINTAMNADPTQLQGVSPDLGGTGPQTPRATHKVFDPEAAQENLNKAGYIQEATELGKQDEVGVTMGGPYGIQGEYSKQHPGHFIPIHDNGLLNSQIQSGHDTTKQIDTAVSAASRLAAAQEHQARSTGDAAGANAIDNMPPISADEDRWGVTSTDPKNMGGIVPHPAVVEAQRAVGHHALAAGKTTAQAMAMVHEKMPLYLSTADAMAQKENPALAASAAGGDKSAQAQMLKLRVKHLGTVMNHVLVGSPQGN